MLPQLMGMPVPEARPLTRLRRSAREAATTTGRTAPRMQASLRRLPTRKRWCGTSVQAEVLTPTAQTAAIASNMTIMEVTIQVIVPPPTFVVGSSTHR